MVAEQVGLPTSGAGADLARADLRQPHHRPARPRQHRPLRLPRPGRAAVFVDWDEATTASAALLRAQVGREPHDRALRDLIGEPFTLSTAFRSQWAAHDVRLHHNGSKRLWHPEVGRLERPPRPHTPPPSPVEEAPSIVGFLGLWRARMPVLAVRPADLRRIAGTTRHEKPHV